MAKIQQLVKNVFTFIFIQYILMKKKANHVSIKLINKYNKVLIRVFLKYKTLIRNVLIS